MAGIRSTCTGRGWPTGTLLDPAAFAVVATDGDQIEPAVAFDGTNYLVVWADTPAATTTSTGPE